MYQNGHVGLDMDESEMELHSRQHRYVFLGVGNDSTSHCKIPHVSSGWNEGRISDSQTDETIPQSLYLCLLSRIWHLELGQRGSYQANPLQGIPPPFAGDNHQEW